MSKPTRPLDVREARNRALDWAERAAALQSIEESKEAALTSIAFGLVALEMRLEHLEETRLTKLL